MRRLIAALAAAALLVCAVPARAEVLRLGAYAALVPEAEPVAVEAAELEAEIAHMLSLYAETDANGDRVAPTLTDDFARAHLGCDSAAAYRTRLEGILLEEKRAARDEARRWEFLDRLAAASEVALDEADVEARAARYRQDCDAYRAQLGLDWAAFCEAVYGIDVEAFEQALRETAAADLTDEALLDAVAADMEIALDDAEYAERRGRFAARYGLDEAGLAARYPDDNLRPLLTREKLWERLLAE